MLAMTFGTDVVFSTSHDMTSLRSPPEGAITKIFFNFIPKTWFTKKKLPRIWIFLKYNLYNSATKQSSKLHIFLILVIKSNHQNVWSEVKPILARNNRFCWAQKVVIGLHVVVLWRLQLIVISHLHWVVWLSAYILIPKHNMQTGHHTH